VGLNKGLRVADGRVDVLKLWHRLFPGDMHADLQKIRNACLSQRVDFGHVSPQEYVVLGFDGATMAQGTLHTLFSLLLGGW
jgi:hypothetical protein